MADFNQTKRELHDLCSHLPAPDSAQEAYILAELACICLRSLEGFPRSTGARFWQELDSEDAVRLRRFLRRASDGVSNAANDLWYRASAADPTSTEEVA